MSKSAAGGSAQLFVVLAIVPELKKKSAKLPLRTKLAGPTRDPAFNESFKIEVPNDVVSASRLELTVWEQAGAAAGSVNSKEAVSDKTGKSVVGQVVLALAPPLPRSLEDPAATSWYALQAPSPTAFLAI